MRTTSALRARSKQNRESVMRTTSALRARSKQNRQSMVNRVTISGVRRRTWQSFVFLVAAMVLSSCGWHGISNVSLPGGPGSGSGAYTVYVQMPDTLAIDGNSRVMVADVFVGSIRKIELKTPDINMNGHRVKNWVATLTLSVAGNVKLPKNVTAKIGQTSLLGSQHIELDPPANPSSQRLKNGDTIP